MGYDISAQSAQRSLENLATTLQVFFADDQDPSPERCADYLRHNLYLLDGNQYKETTKVLASDRRHLEHLEPHLQQLGGALIHNTIDREQLLELINPTEVGVN